jgi:hypothetical protein
VFHWTRGKQTVVYDRFQPAESNTATSPLTPDRWYLRIPRQPDAMLRELERLFVG